MYCGIGPVPKGKERGTAEYCANNKQIRYFGLEKLTDDVIKQLLNKKKKEKTLLQEQFALKKLEDRGKMLLNKVKNLTVIIENPDERPSKVKSADKELVLVKKQINTLLKKYKSQKKLVKKMEEDQEKKEKATKKKSKKKAKK